MSTGPKFSRLLCVPLEIRAEILRHLLNASYTRKPQGVRVEDLTVTRYAWCFHPAVLAVSRQLHQEGRDVLAENRFVVVERPPGILGREPHACRSDNEYGIISLWPRKPLIKQASIPVEEMRV